jgi:hypothetical protein
VTSIAINSALGSLRFTIVDSARGLYIASIYSYPQIAYRFTCQGLCCAG